MGANWEPKIFLTLKINLKLQPTLRCNVPLSMNLTTLTRNPEPLVKPQPLACAKHSRWGGGHGGHKQQTVEMRRAGRGPEEDGGMGGGMGAPKKAGGRRGWR